jgi:hypothetical protein
MPETTIKVEKFTGLTELPIHNQPPGKLSVCHNLRVTTEGMLEARGGLEKLKPSGGTATAPIAAGIYTGAHEHISPVAWIFRFDGAATYTKNLALQAYVDYFSGTAVGNRFYIISPKPITNIIFNVGTAGVGAYTINWRFLDTGGTPQALTGVTEDFKTLGTRTVTFASPATIGLNSVNNVYGYVYYAEVATAVIGTMPTQKDQRIHINWEGMKEIYLGSSDSAGGAANGTIQRYGQNGTTAVWTAVTSSLTSTSDPRVRFASWRGYLYWLNGYEQKRYNLDSVADMGFAVPTGALTTAAGGGTGLTGLFHYAVTYGYGAAGELGESLGLQTTATVAPVNQDVTITLSGLTSVPAKGTVDVIYVYRTVDLSTAAAISTSYGAFPFYRVKTVTRDANGNFPATTQDNTMKVPQPISTLNPVPNLPPSKCQFISPHRSRLFMAKNNVYPGRVWWSKNFEPESFNQDEDFADLTAGTGGGITAMIEFADQMIVYTEDTMYGITNVDQDQPYIYVIAKGVGCVAPESLRTGYGLLLWLSRGGLYAWDGNSAPQRISDDLPLSFYSMTVESHGNSRALIYNGLYEILLVSQSDTVTSAYSGQRFRFDLGNRTWSTSVLNLSDIYLGPLVTLTAPLGHEDFGFRHPFYGKIQSAGTLFHVYVGEFKTVDDGGAIVYAVQAPVGPPHGQSMTARRLIAVYRVLGVPGWVSPPTLGLIGAIGDAPAAGATFPAVGTNYNVAMAQVTAMVGYAADVTITFQVNSQTGGVANRQYLVGLYLDVTVFPMPMRTD